MQLLFYFMRTINIYFQQIFGIQYSITKYSYHAMQ